MKGSKIKIIGGNTEMKDLKIKIIGEIQRWRDEIGYFGDGAL